MSESFYEPEVPATEFGAWMREQHFARMRANADVMNEMLSGGGQDAFRATSDQLRAAHQGLFPNMSPYDRGADAANRQAVVGSAYGGRPLERLGGTFNHGDVGCSPAPPRADLRFVNEPGGPPAADQMSPLAAYMRSQR